MVAGLSATESLNGGRQCSSVEVRQFRIDIHSVDSEQTDQTSEIVRFLNGHYQLY